MSNLTERVDATVAAATGDAAAVRQAAARQAAWRATQAARTEMRQAQGWLRRHVGTLLGVAAVSVAIVILLLVR